MNLQPLDHNYSYGLRDDLRDRWDQVYGSEVREIEVVSFAAEGPVGLEPILDGKEHDRFGWFDLGEADRLLDWPVEDDALPYRRTALRNLMARLQHRP